MFLFAVVFLLAASSNAGSGMMVVRDAETEDTIRAMATPLFQAAGVAPEAVHLFILNDKTPNAFVAEGLRLFIHTGLILKTETSGQLTGVLAHETGHIVGGHLIGLREELDTARMGSLLAMVAGAAAAIASGRGDVGMGVAMAGQQAAMRTLFSFSRMQESAADQAAVRLLETTNQSAQGLMDFFNVLNTQEILLTHQQDPYVRTHPLTRERIEFVRHHVETSPRTTTPLDPILEERHQRVRAKLLAFLEPSARVLSRYKPADASVPARYARAIAFYRKADLVQALPLMEGLITEWPKDPYFFEMKGQMLFENGRLVEAGTAYRHAVSLLPDNALLRTSLGQVLIETEKADLLEEATGHLTRAVQREPGNAFSWRLLSIAYGHGDNTPMTAYALAEYALLVGDTAQARHHAERAKQMLPKGSPSAVRAQDIVTEAEYRIKQKGSSQNPRP